MTKTFFIHPDARARQEMLDAAKSRVDESEDPVGSPSAIDGKRESAATTEDEPGKRADE